MDKNQNTEQKILEAARKVFLKKGYQGARMQEIADEADINKALLHYYFRSKKRLFEKIFDAAFKGFGEKVLEVFSSNTPLEVTIWNFVDHYISFIQKNPYIPSFILNEVREDPALIADKIPNISQAQSHLHVTIREEVEKGNIRDISAMELVNTMIGLSIFPFISKNIMIKVFNISDDEFDEFIESRKAFIPKLIMDGIRK